MTGFRTTGHDALIALPDDDGDGDPRPRICIIYPKGREHFAAWIVKCLEGKAGET